MADVNKEPGSAYKTEQSWGLSWILIVQFSFICYVLYGERRCGMLANKINLRHRQNGEIRHRGTDVYYN